MQFITRSCLTVLLLLLSAPGWASEQSDRLVELLQYQKQFDNYLAACKKTTRVQPPEKVYEATPGYFYGFTPQSKEWPQVVAIYKAYYDAACSYATPKELAHILSTEYERNLSAADLDKAIRFYSSPAGQRMVKAHMMTNEEFQRILFKRSREISLQAGKEYDRKMRRLAAEAHK